MSAQKKQAQRIEPALFDPSPPSFEVIQQDGQSLGSLPVAYIEGLIISGALQPDDRLTVPQLGSIRLIDCELVKRFFEQRRAAEETEAAEEIEGAENLGEFSLDLETANASGISMNLDALVPKAETVAPATASMAKASVESATLVATPPANDTNGQWSDYDPFADEPVAVPVADKPVADKPVASMAPDANAQWCDFDPLSDEAMAHQGQEGPPAESGPQDDLGFLQTGLQHMSARAYTDAATCFAQIEDPKLLDLARAGSAFARFMRHSGREAKQRELQAVESILEISGDVDAVHIIAGRMAALLGNNECARDHQAKGTHPQPDLLELRTLAAAISVRGPSAPAMVTPKPSKAPAKAPTGADRERGTHLAFIATIFGLVGLLLAAPTIHASFSLHPRWLFGGQILAIAAAASLLTLGPGMKLKVPEFINPSASQTFAALVAGLLIGAALPGIGLPGSFITALAVRMALMVGLELLLRGSVDRWLQDRLGGVLKPTLASGALFGLLYTMAISARVDSVAVAGGLATVVGLALAGIDFKYAAPRLATLAHIAAAITAAVVVG